MEMKLVASVPLRVKLTEDFDVAVVIAAVEEGAEGLMLFVGQVDGVEYGAVRFDGNPLPILVPVSKLFVWGPKWVALSTFTPAATEDLSVPVPVRFGPLFGRVDIVSGLLVGTFFDQRCWGVVRIREVEAVGMNYIHVEAEHILIKRAECTWMSFVEYHESVGVVDGN